MTFRRDPFRTALSHLTAQLQIGAYGFGRPVVIAEEAAALKLSPTPVREALAWLCGYGLVERSPRGGYVSLRLDADLLRARLRFRLTCLKLGLDRGGTMPPVQGDDFSPEAWMRWSVRSTGDPALIDAYVRVSRQLALVGPVERVVFDDVDAEAARLNHLFGTRGAGLEAALERFHERRIAAAAHLALAAEAAHEPQGSAG